MGHHSIFPCAVKLGKTPRAVAREDSDVDLLVVEAEPFGAERTRLGEMSRIRQALSRFRVAKDILVYSKEEVEKWRDSLNHVIAHSLREGRVLYERP